MRYTRHIGSLWFAAAVLGVLGHRAGASQIAVGELWTRVVAVHGKPSREIVTDNGSLAFYGSLLVGVENGTVRFLSRGEVLPEARGRDEAGPGLPPAPTARVALKAEGPRTWIEAGQERQVRLLAERLRRCLAFDVYGRMLSQIPWRQYYDGRHHSYSGCRSLERYLHPSDAKATDVGDGVTLVDLRDSQSMRIAGHGSEFMPPDRCVAVQQSFRSSNN